METLTEDQKMHRQIAVKLFNHVWELMDNPNRSLEENDEMIHSAHASRYHWGEIGTPLEFERGEWQISRVYCVLKRAEPALYHARRTLQICLEYEIGDFDLAFAYEAMARASLIAGEIEECKNYLDLAYTASNSIKEEDDQKILLEDLESIQSQII
ncbi:MAG: hypothetical protein CVU46_12110 [Chloroflexi bacterium HGW-Chloroflexi-8]|nr:MAG: hypothetical protein CVU46_12110 [Chloroflexi bacterium HGW-Chloroflexi-8]